MDSQHRHDLEQNDLADFLTHFQDWWVKHGMKTLLVVLAIVVAVFAWQAKQRADKNARDEAWYELATATSPESFHAVAREHGDASVRLLAHLRAADAAFFKAQGGKDPASQLSGVATPALTDEERGKLLAGAQEDYQKVVNEASAPLLLRLNAMLGLASISETQHKWDEARQQYKKIQELAGSKYGAIKAQAEGREELIDRASKPVAFAPEPSAIRVVDDPAEITPATTQPASTTPETPAPAPAAATPPATDTPAAPAAVPPADNAKPAAP